MEGEGRYRRPRWTAAGVTGCLIWPVAFALFIDPMIDLMLGPRFFEEGYGLLDGLGFLLVLAATLVLATVASLRVYLTARFVFVRSPEPEE